MPTPARRTIAPSLLAAVVATFPGASAAQGLMDCTPPLLPAAVTNARVLAEYAAELREEYALFFDEAQVFFRCLERARIAVTEDVNQAIADYGALEVPHQTSSRPNCPSPIITFTKDRPMARLSTLLSAGLVSIVATCLQPSRAVAYPVDCAILLCLAGGWPASAECVHARAVFIARITPWPIEPPLQIWNCPMRASFAVKERPLDQLLDIAFPAENALPLFSKPEVPSDILRVQDAADVDISDPAFDFARSIRVFEITFQQHRNSDGDCNTWSAVYEGSYGEQGDYLRRRSSPAAIPEASDFSNLHFCGTYWHRSVFVEWRDFEGTYGHEEVHY